MTGTAGYLSSNSKAMLLVNEMVKIVGDTDSTLKYYLMKFITNSKKPDIDPCLASASPASIYRKKPTKKYPSHCSVAMLERGERYFLDVGSWHSDHEGQAHTDFGLVSGHYVLLCSWLNMEKKGLKYPDYCNKFSRSTRRKETSGIASFTCPIEAFFDMPKGMPWGAIISHFKAATSFTSENELIVFIPDLHLHLFKNTVIDNFQYDWNFGVEGLLKKKVSLEKHLSQLLEQAQAIGAQIIQVGDCFEIWESQIHLIKDYESLTDKLEDIQRWFESYRLSNLGGITTLERFKRDEERGRIRAQPYIKMFQKRKVIPRNDLTVSIGSLAHVLAGSEAFGISELLTTDHVDEFGIPIDDSATKDLIKSQVDIIRDRIMERHPLIFFNDRLKRNVNGMPFTWLRGNHDNMRQNNFYTNNGAKEFPIEASRILKQAKLPADEPQAYDIYRGGIDNCIQAEHGDRLDSPNRASTFDQEWKGYDLTRLFTTGGGFLKLFTTEGGLLEPFGETGYHQGLVMLKAQEINENWFYYMRVEQLKRVFDIFQDQSVSLVVMGHTHTAVLVDWGIFLREVTDKAIENWRLKRILWGNCGKNKTQKG